MEILSALFVLIGTILLAIICFHKFTYAYWERKNVPCEKPKTTFNSITNGLFQRDAFVTNLRKQYDWAKAGGHKHCGIFTLWAPIYFPLDPKIIKHILTIDFPVFISRGTYYNKKNDPLSVHLFSLDGHDWRNLRVKLTPTFTSGKMKMMIRTVTSCGEKLNKCMNHLASLNESFDVGEIAGQFTTDVIGSCAFGLECNSFENPNSEFITNGKRILRTNVLKQFLAFSFPKLSAKIGLRLIGEEISAFYLKIVKETIEYREKNKIVRNDFMQQLIAIKNEHTNDKTNRFDLEEIAAQALLFFFAGYETSSSTMTFCLYELSVNPDIQDKVREEIRTVLDKHEGKVTYEAIAELKFMGQVVDETLRKYPALPVLFRKNVADYKLPDSNVILEKGTLVFIPTMGLHYDEEYFPDPDKFDPDRFSDENKGKINPYTYLPFGEGPRNCIGLRFGIMQAKVGLTYFLKDYKFSLSKKTSVPFKMDPKTIMLSVLGGIWLNASKVTS